MAYYITEEEYKAICAEEEGVRNERISRRLKVLMLRYEGKRNNEIAEVLDISSSRLSHLISEYKRVGLVKYLQDKHPGDH